MNTSLKLIEVSIWITFFKSNCPEEILCLVKDLILKKEAIITPPVLFEILRGAKDKREYQSLWEKFSALDMLPVTDEVWQYSYSLSFALKTKGITIPSIDTLIASIALVHDCTLLHKDKHFEMIKEIAPLKTIFFKD
ncbi:MAG: PIN domain-containing protein [bacterium]